MKEEEEVSEKEVDKVEMEEEKRSSEEVTTFEQIMDHSDSLMVNQDPNLSNLAINSPKDYSESDDDIMNENLKAQAKASMATKSTSGSFIMVIKSTTEDVLP